METNQSLISGTNDVLLSLLLLVVFMNCLATIQQLYLIYKINNRKERWKQQIII